LRSWLWLGHSKTFKCLPLNHSRVALAVCLGSMSCWCWTSVPVSHLWKTEAGFPQEFPFI
jgi:hypothetical protein